jgi:hypothetical protein
LGALASSAALFACGASVSTTDYGNGSGGSTTSDAATGSDVALPPSPSDGGIASAMEVAFGDVGATDCPAPDPGGKARICVTVNVAAYGPMAATDATALGIDGIGGLVVGLSATPPTVDTKFDAWTLLPSAASGATLHVTELPKTVQIDVDPGTYYIAAAFRDTPPYDRKTTAIGDYETGILEADALPKVTAIAGQGVVAPPMTLSPVRGFDTTVRLAPALLYTGSGSGPLGARLTELGTTNLAALLAVQCVDLAGGGPFSTRIYTTDTATDYDLRVVLFDYARDLFDVGVVGWLTGATSVDAPTAGSICRGIHEKPVHVTLPSTRWLGDPVDVSLDDVWGDVTPGTTDKSLSCRSIALP